MEKVMSKAVVAAVLMLLIGAVGVFAQSVEAENQSVEAGMVTISSVTSDGPGWIVIHADAEGSPGEVIGYAPVADGTTENVTVEIDEARLTDTLYAMLHTDAGTEGSYEFPGPDGPVSVDGQVVLQSFTVE